MTVSKTKSWKRLLEHLQNDLADVRIEHLVEDKKRFDALSFQLDELFVDFSKQKVNTKTLSLLQQLAEEVNLKSAIENLVCGNTVNSTENRPALHTACRLSANDSLTVEGREINSDIQTELERMSGLIDALVNGHWRGYSGKPITDVVNLGVGGSDLGPLLVCHALDEFKARHHNPVNIHFASTMDGSQVSDVFEKLNPETTLFVIVSKSFGTIDTLSNAASAKAWLLSHHADESLIEKQHFIGVSASEAKMNDWGIHPGHQLKLWEWVGGRFSLWSSVGLTIALKLGMENFRALLAGANAVDRHFAETELSQNVPVLLGLIGVWNTNFLKINAQAILPYDARLKYFPDYLMQLEMESNGKSVTSSGEPVEVETCPILWGEVGPNAQHAFYQLMHQGTRKVTSDFIAPVRRFTNENSEHGRSLQEQHLLTLANCFAQSRALMVGSSISDFPHPSPLPEGEGASFPNSPNPAPDDTLSSHKFYPGDQPSTTILLSELSPYSLGQLIALYEHKVFVMATIWDINPFDQWGVELGKNIAKKTLEELHSKDSTSQFDCSTNGLMNWVK